MYAQLLPLALPAPPMPGMGGGAMGGGFAPTPPMGMGMPPMPAFGMPPMGSYQKNKNETVGARKFCKLAVCAHGNINFSSSWVSR